MQISGAFVSKTASEIWAFIGYALFFLFAWLIASPVLLLLRWLVLRVDQAHYSASISILLKVGCYVLMIASLMTATLVALGVSLTAAQRRSDRRQGTSSPNPPPS